MRNQLWIMNENMHFATNIFLESFEVCPVVRSILIQQLCFNKKIWLSSLDTICYVNEESFMLVWLHVSKSVLNDKIIDSDGSTEKQCGIYLLVEQRLTLFHNVQFQRVFNLHRQSNPQSEAEDACFV